MRYINYIICVKKIIHVNGYTFYFTRPFSMTLWWFSDILDILPILPSMIPSILPCILYILNITPIIPNITIICIVHYTKNILLKIFDQSMMIKKSHLVIKFYGSNVEMKPHSCWGP